MHRESLKYIQKNRFIYVYAYLCFPTSLYISYRASKLEGKPLDPSHRNLKLHTNHQKRESGLVWVV